MTARQQKRLLRVKRHQMAQSLARQATSPNPKTGTAMVADKSYPDQSKLGQSNVPVARYWNLYDSKTGDLKFSGIASLRRAWRTMPAMRYYSPTADMKRKAETAKATLGR